MRRLIACCLLLVIVPISFAQNDARPGSVADDRPALENRDDITEGFDDITNLPGWSIVNNSAPMGVNDYFQGNPMVFNAHMGADDAYIAANFNSTTGGTGTISTWLISPVIDFSVTESISFWTRTATPGATAFADRMEFRASNAGTSTNVGAGATDVGDFSTLLVSVNPSLDPTGYPSDWTQFTITDFSGLSGEGRVAFRYFVTDGGPAGANSNFIGIDTFELIEITCTLTSITLNGNNLVIEGNCPDGADIYAFDTNGTPTLVASNVSVDGTTTIPLASVLPDSVYGAINAGGQPGDVVIFTNRTVPTLGEWGMVVFLAGLAFAGIFMMRRRRAIA